MNPAELAILAAILAQNDEMHRGQLPIMTKARVAEDYFDEAYELLYKANVFIQKKNQAAIQRQKTP